MRQPLLLLAAVAVATMSFRSAKAVALQHAGGDAALQHAAGDAALQHAAGDVALQHAAGDAALQHAGGDVALQRAAGDVPLQHSAGDVAPQHKGGEDETGPYEVVEQWPTDWAKPGYIWGSQPGIFAESPDRIFIAARGELRLPDKLGRGYNGTWGSLGQRATEPKPEMRNCIVVVDGRGRLIEAWTQWDSLFEGGGGPHKIRISPYDRERHVWVVNDARHVIYEFTNDGKQLARTLGETDVPGDDGGHFNRPQDIAWLPDGTLLVADGLGNGRIAKFDREGKFLGAFGSRGNGQGQLSGVHGVAADARRRIYVADRSNHRIQVFDENGKFLDLWPGLRQPNDILISPDQHVWIADGTNAKVLEYDTSGMLLSSWGTYGTFPGQFWELHQMSIDAEGNLYGADSFGGRVQKFRPRAGAERARLIGRAPK